MNPDYKLKNITREGANVKATLVTQASGAITVRLFVDIELRERGGYKVVGLNNLYIEEATFEFNFESMTALNTLRERFPQILFALDQLSERRWNWLSHDERKDRPARDHDYIGFSAVGPCCVHLNKRADEQSACAAK